MLCAYVHEDALFVQVQKLMSGYLLQSFLYIICFEAESVTESGASHFSFNGWPVKPKNFPVFSPSTGVTDTCCHTRRVCWCCLSVGFPWFLRNSL